MYNRNKVFAAACIGLLLFGMTLLIPGSILPELNKSFKLSQELIGGVLPAGILLGSLVFGPIVDRYGYKLLLIASILITALAVEGIAYASSSQMLYTCFFFIGFGGGIINGVTSALVADISSENKGASLSLLGVSYGIGALGMPLLLGALTKSFSYNTTLAVVGLIMLIPVLLFFTLKFPSPKQAQGFPLKEGIKLLKEPVLLLTSFFLFFQSGIESLMNIWTTSFLQYKLKVTTEQGLFALSFILVGLTVGRLIGGLLMKKLSSFLILVISLLFVVAGNIILLQTQSYNMAFAALIFTGLGLAAGFPVMLGYIGQLYAKLSGTAFSIALVIALTGNTIINSTFGKIMSSKNPGYLPVMMLIYLACMFVLLFIIRQKISSKVKL